jgi:integrase
MGMKLTQTRIDKLECKAGSRDRLVFDTEQRGLGVRVTSSGSKTYLVQYRHAAQKRRVPLGSCSAINLAKARELASQIMGQRAGGQDPAAERKQAALEAKSRAKAEALTLDVLIENWAAQHLATRRPDYRAEATRALRFAFDKQLKLPAASLEQSDVKATLKRISDAGKRATARLTGAYGRACYAWAINEGVATANPFKNMSLPTVPARKRVLKDAELVAIWRATGLPTPYNSIVRMLLITGQRREEVAGMAWREISPDHSTWTIPADRAKNGVEHIVPLSKQARSILRSARQVDGSGIVFPGRRGSFNGFGKAKAQLDLASGVTRWRLHDLRRTVATGLQKRHVPLEVTEAVLNHVSGKSRAGIVGVYQLHDWAKEKRYALDSWGMRVAAIERLAGRPST